MRSALIASLLLGGLAVSAFATDSTDLKHRVKEHLIARPYLHAGWIRVRTEGGTVTLVGRVPDDLLRVLVVQGVRNLPGVKVVKDDLEIDPKLPPWKPTTVEKARIRLENARRTVRGDSELGRYTTLHVARTRSGVVVTGDIASPEERGRLRRILDGAHDVTVEVRVSVKPDAARRADAPPVRDAASVAFVQSVTDAIAREPLLAGRIDVKVSIERGALVLRGTAQGLPEHDLVVEIARAQLRAREREAERIRAASGELTKLLAGDPGTLEGELPARVDSLICVDGAP